MSPESQAGLQEEIFSGVGVARCCSAVRNHGSHRNGRWERVRLRNANDE